MLDFYGRYICVKIMPTGVNPERFLDAFSWSDTTWRLGELRSQVHSEILCHLSLHFASNLANIIVRCRPVCAGQDFYALQLTLHDSQINPSSPQVMVGSLL